MLLIVLRKQQLLAVIAFALGDAIVAGMEGQFCPRFTVPMQERCRKQQNTTNPTNFFHRAGAEMTTADKLFARFVGFVYRFVGIVYRFVGIVRAICRDCLPE